MYLAADYSSVCLKDEFSGKNVLDDLNTNQDVKEKLENWNGNYKLIIPKDKEERILHLELIKELDAGEWLYQR